MGILSPYLRQQLCTQLLNQLSRRRRRGRWVLPGDQQAVADHIRTPVRPFRVNPAFGNQLVFCQERHNLRQAHGFLFAVGKTCDLTAFYQRFSLRGFDVAQHARRMADQSDVLVCRQECFDKGDGVFIFGQVPQRSVTTRIKNGVVISL